MDTLILTEQDRYTANNRALIAIPLFRKEGVMREAFQNLDRRIRLLASFVNDNGGEKGIEPAIVSGSWPIGLDGHKLLRPLYVSVDNFLVGQVGLRGQASKQRFKLVIRNTAKGKRLIENGLTAAMATDAPELLSHARLTLRCGPHLSTFPHSLKSPRFSAKSRVVRFLDFCTSRTLGIISRPLNQQKRACDGDERHPRKYRVPECAASRPSQVEKRNEKPSEHARCYRRYRG